MDPLVLNNVTQFACLDVARCALEQLIGAVGPLVEYEAFAEAFKGRCIRTQANVIPLLYHFLKRHLMARISHLLAVV